MLFDWGLQFQTVFFVKPFCFGENVCFKILEVVHVCNGTQKKISSQKGCECVVLSYTQ